jgi:hypothetical protein
VPGDVATLHTLMKAARDTSQALQRVKVGLTGLAAVILLIAMASAIMRTVTREAPMAGTGAAKVVADANTADTNSSDDSTGEPLAELGVAPSSSNAAQAARGGQ